MRFSNWPNKLTALWLAVLSLVGIVLLSMWFSKSIHIQTNIFALLPELSQDQQLEQTQHYVSEQLNNKVFVLLDAKDETQLNQATVQFKQQVQKSQLWQPLQAQVDTAAIGKVLFEHRAGLLRADDVHALTNQDYAALTEQGLLQIMSPGLPITADFLRQDPLLLFPRYVLNLSQQQHSAVEMQEGFATVHDERGWSRLFVLELKQSPYNIDYQEQSSDWMQTVEQKLAALDVKLHWTGTLRFASYGTHSAQQEISTIGLGSSLGILFLVWFGFRSLRPMLTEFIAVTTGSLVAFTVTHLVFGEIHLVTLVFGASLIGVCVDFSYYFMAIQSQHRGHNGFLILKPLLPSLFMGLLTTLVAYVFLSISPFPGFKQIAVFSMVGLVSAWITSILLLPRLPALNAAPAIRTLRFIGHAREYFQTHKSLRWGSIATILVLGVTSLFWLKPNDQIQNLQSMDQQLKQEDQYIRERFSQQQSSDYFVVRGETTAELEQHEQQLITQLNQLKTQAKLQGFQALGQWIPSAVEQRQHISLLQNIPKDVLREYAASMQLDAHDVLAWQAQLATQPILTLDQMKQHPLAFLQRTPTERLVMLQGIEQLDALKALNSPNVQLLQPVQSLSDLFKQHRIQAQWLLVAAMITLALGLGWVYGRAAILPLVLPVTLALISTFAVQAWLGVEINLFSLMGTFLIIGIGVDYAIFYRHGHDHAQVVGMALFLCMMSTFFGFGLLAFSQTYAIHCFGLTVLLGVVFAFIYATLFTSSDAKHVVMKKIQSEH